MGETTDLLVVGSGIAGCAAALAGARAGADVTVATKASRPQESTSYWAQGGIAVTRGDPAALKRDVLAAGDGASDPDAVDVLVSAADDAVRDVLVETLGVEFDAEYGREAAHGEARIRHVDAATGKHLLVPFLEHLRDREAVTILEDAAALELCTHEGRIHGALLERDGTVTPWFAGATVLATGGIGACYRRSTNPRTATGDGIAMAALAGADVADMEYVQFHPTAFAGDERDEQRGRNEPGGRDETRGTFLLSEAVRGAGAVLRDATGERFMVDRHPDAELAPRDVVARAVADARERTGEVVLDVTPVDFAGEFPELASACADRGVDPESGIPVAPAEHFLCGGIDVDARGRTSLDRLYAVGECARTGVHGANRLASTSLLEGLVWGRRAGAAAGRTSAERGPEPIAAPDLADRDPDLPDRFAAEKAARLRRVMESELGIVRDPEGIERARAALRRLKGEVDAYTRTRTSRSLYELRGACVSALLVARAAAANDRSRGCHRLQEGTPANAD
ncbi:L-aspartate oxidase [Halopenitus persicus]|uniref:L-aspartate oxidase n=1 Tax=Halopenitus persicus TaxID=1048396 RepID=A0A1H3J238_9EURY|nr:FAD-dependent oxidoreductase [Halopenitus persicus]SDY33609.1 L-aspartate oxidase [Halopenitus persicus]